MNIEQEIANVQIKLREAELHQQTLLAQAVALKDLHAGMASAASTFASTGAKYTRQMTAILSDLNQLVEGARIEAQVMFRTEQDEADYVASLRHQLSQLRQERELDIQNALAEARESMRYGLL